MLWHRAHANSHAVGDRCALSGLPRIDAPGMRNPGARRWDLDTAWLVAIAAFLSAASFLYYLRHGDVLLYGDAVAHINIARRVFDSRTPGPLQLGTVWLPLPHILMMPFIVSRWMWQTGIGGAIPSMVAYLFSVMGIFQLVRGVFPRSPKNGEAWGTPSKSPNKTPISVDAPARFAAWLAAGVFALNPNL